MKRFRSSFALFIVTAATASAQQPAAYPPGWWTPVPESQKASWEILPQSAKPGEVILSKRNELGILSNFAATSFTFRGKRYASVEGFWQMMLYPERSGDPRANAPGITWPHTRDEVAQMTGFEAKAAGTLAEDNMRKLGIDWVTFQGRRILYRSKTKGDHYQLIVQAMRAKLEQNVKVREILLATGHLILLPDHVQEPDAPPEWLYCRIWMEFRTELQRTLAHAEKPEFFDEPQFTVAGVTDNTYRGGHGSDTPLRSTEALAKATAALKESPVDSPSSPNNAESGRHHSLADLDERQGKALEAVREYQRAAELDPSEPNIFDWGAELLSHRATEPAVEVFEKGNRLFPGSVRMLLGLAVALYARGDYAEAERRFFEASDLNPSDSGPYLFLGKIQSREITQSEGYLERLARFATLQPDNALANYYYAVALWKRRTNPEDLETPKQVRLLLEKAIRLDPNLGTAWLQAGILYSDQKNFTEAISAYRKAIEFAPEMEEAHYRLSQAYTVTGDTQKAQEELDLYKQLSKKSAEEAERERRELQQFVIGLRGELR